MDTGRGCPVVNFAYHASVRSLQALMQAPEAPPLRIRLLTCMHGLRFFSCARLPQPYPPCVYTRRCARKQAPCSFTACHKANPKCPCMYGGFRLRCARSALRNSVWLGYALTRVSPSWDSHGLPFAGRTHGRVRKVAPLRLRLRHHMPVCGRLALCPARLPSSAGEHHLTRTPLKGGFGVFVWRLREPRWRWRGRRWRRGPQPSAPKEPRSPSRKP